MLTHMATHPQLSTKAMRLFGEAKKKNINLRGVYSKSSKSSTLQWHIRTTTTDHTRYVEFSCNRTVWSQFQILRGQLVVSTSDSRTAPSSLIDLLGHIIVTHKESVQNLSLRTLPVRQFVFPLCSLYSRAPLLLNSAPTLTLIDW